MTIDEAQEVVRSYVQQAHRGYSAGPQFDEALETLLAHVPPIMGTKDAGALLAVKPPNVAKTLAAHGVEPVTRISGGTIPVYLASQIEHVRAERQARRAAAE